MPDRAGILQERLELRCEDGVAVIDLVLRITDQMGEAECVHCGGSRSDSHTFGRTPARKSVGTHLLRVGAIMMDGGAAAERPLPVRLALHARAGLVAGDHRWRRSALLPHRTWRLLHAGVIASSALIRSEGIDI